MPALPADQEGTLKSRHITILSDLESLGILESDPVHRVFSSFTTGPTGNVNPSVGYLVGFRVSGVLQVRE